MVPNRGNRADQVRRRWLLSSNRRIGRLLRGSHPCQEITLQWHAAEDALAEDLNARGAHGVPGFKLLPNEIRGDAEDTLARLKETGANEVVLMRVVGADKRPSFTEVRGTASRGGWTASNGDETRGASNATGVTELRHFDTLVSVETLVCSLDRDEPLWSSTSRTTNPKDIEKLVNEVADATAKEMVKQGFLARQ